MYRILVVDDEPDIHTITKMSLKNLEHEGRKVELLSAHSGREAIEILQRDASIGVVLLDVVMESDHAGLDACKTIRLELQNRFVRIILRTGQPGQAPERQTIDSYDIDGYLPKADLTATKLYSSIRTALRAYTQLFELERHRRMLAALHECVLSLRSFAPLDESLRYILATAATLCPSPLAVLNLTTFDAQGDTQNYFLHLSTDPDAGRSETAAQDVRARVASAGESRSSIDPQPFDRGWLVPIALHRELGHGWIYVEEPKPDDLIRKSLGLLGSHTANALYASVAQSMLEEREGPAFEAMTV